MTWKAGRQLAAVSNGSNALSFDYNESGLRTSKIVNGTQTQYIWSGDRLVAELGPDCSFYFHYDAAGEMTGYTYKAGSTTTECLFVKNLQGDVERVISDTGMLLATYTYDAWGNLCQSSGSLADINPIRYRSYYYDSETGLYYLQSRYYDPQIGRFVNANGQIDSNAGLVGANLFSYTANNPVHSIDDSGSSVIVVAGAVLGGCAGYKIAESNGYTGWKKAGAITAGASHNLIRTAELKNALNSIGIYDNAIGRATVTDALNQAYQYVNQGDVNLQTGRITVDSLLSGPNGFLLMRTIWEENKLITFFLNK